MLPTDFASVILHNYPCLTDICKCNLIFGSSWSLHELRMLCNLKHAYLEGSPIPPVNSQENVHRTSALITSFMSSASSLPALHGIKEGGAWNRSTSIPTPSLCLHFLHASSNLINLCHVPPQQSFPPPNLKSPKCFHCIITSRYRLLHQQASQGSNQQKTQITTPRNAFLQ